jgi:hypothetical protein
MDDKFQLIKHLRMEAIIFRRGGIIGSITQLNKGKTKKQSKDRIEMFIFCEKKNFRRAGCVKKTQRVRPFASVAAAPSNDLVTVALNSASHLSKCSFR